MLLNPSKSTKEFEFGGVDDDVEDEKARDRLPVVEVLDVVVVVVVGGLVTNVINDDIPGGADCVDDGPDDDVVVSRSDWSGDGRSCCCLLDTA